MFQSSVPYFQALGLPGQRYRKSPMRAESLIINSNGATPNTYGYWATKNGQTDIAQMGGVVGQGSASFTASTAGTVLTVTAVASGALQVGQTISGTGVTAGTTITSYGTGTGGVGTYNISVSQTVASEAMTSSGGPILVPGGLLAITKEATLWGTDVGGTLAPTLAIPDNAQGDFATMGEFVIALPNACNIGDNLAYNVSTGALSSFAPGGTPAAGSVQLPNGVVAMYAITSVSGGYTIGRFTN